MKYLNPVVALLMVLIYALGKIPPSEHYNLWVVYYMIPFVLLANLSLTVITLIRRRKSGLFYVLALIIGSNYLVSTFAIKSFFKRKDISGESVISVLNYNVSSFNERWDPRLLKPPANAPDSALVKLKNWVLYNSADIQCYQEFPYFPRSQRRDMLKEFAGRGYHHYFSSSEKNPDGSGFGILIVSKFPIVARGDIRQSLNGYNRIAFADVKINLDTVRIINVHLESMSMKQYNPVYANDIENKKRNLKMVLWRLRSGVFERSKQFLELTRFIETSPYPVICVGDFNEIPYSYSYQSMKKNLKNAFEESGRGFGFTYNGKTLGMLRIDNQFYSPEISSIDLKTMRLISFTDHFPLLGYYRLKD